MNPQQSDSNESSSITVVKGSKLHMKRLKSVKENSDEGMFRNFSVGLTPILPQKNTTCD